MAKILDTGNNACAKAVVLARPDVVAAYPITPQTSVSEKIAEFVADGTLHARYIPVEGEHSALAAVAAASTAGARVFTATSSQGIAYMHEIMHYAAGGRLPIVMANVNRALNAPWCLYVDHQDSVSQRDTGWMQIYCGDNQEIHDFILLAYRVAEEVSIPIIVCYDGFLLSHSMAPFEEIPREVADKFLPEYNPAWRLHPSVGRETFSAVTPAKEYSEFRARLAKDLNGAAEVIEKFGRELDALTGHHVCSMLAPYKTEGAEYFVLSMGSMAVEAELAIDKLREAGVSVGSIRVKLYRPFPGKALSRLIPDGAKLIVLDRNYAYGTECGALYADTLAALFARGGGNIKAIGRAVGIGGMELTTEFLTETIKGAIAEMEGR